MLLIAVVAAYPTSRSLTRKFDHRESKLNELRNAKGDVASNVVSERDLKSPSYSHALERQPPAPDDLNNREKLSIFTKDQSTSNGN